jgi:hypothetical protein
MRARVRAPPVAIGALGRRLLQQLRTKCWAKWGTEKTGRGGSETGSDAGGALRRRISSNKKQSGLAAARRRDDTSPRTCSQQPPQKMQPHGRAAGGGGDDRQSERRAAHEELGGAGVWSQGSLYFSSSRGVEALKAEKRKSVTEDGDERCAGLAGAGTWGSGCSTVCNTGRLCDCVTQSTAHTATAFNTSARLVVQIEGRGAREGCALGLSPRALTDSADGSLKTGRGGVGGVARRAFSMLWFQLLATEAGM